MFSCTGYYVFGWTVNTNWSYTAVNATNASFRIVKGYKELRRDTDFLT